MAGEMAQSSPPGSIEELARCPNCHRAFDEAEHEPKLLQCRHYFCLTCTRHVLGAGREIYCVHCWKRTVPPGGLVEHLPTHAPVLALALRLQNQESEALSVEEQDVCAPHVMPALWCATCNVLACRACTEHAPHMLRPAAEVRAMLLRDARALHSELTQLAERQRNSLLRALDAATALKVRLEGELASPVVESEPSANVALPVIAAERDRLKALYDRTLINCRLDDLARCSLAPVNFDLLRNALAAAEVPGPPEAVDPVLFLANYCMAQLFARSLTAAAPPSPSTRPHFFFALEIDGAPAGRVVIALREDAAPRMSRNFAALATGELGVGYRGCSVFQCWEGESVITGDFELNNGRGGRSVYAEGYFMPDDSRLPAVRGSVGMRRSQKRHDMLGLVGSQFRIILREMRGFSAIFGNVVEGLEIVDRLSGTGDLAGKPHSSIFISNCGRL
ncbi:uncharacterized protein LOC134667526 [Cydia fagiglandana]|uniref:uncharacterized protein LOC134667526 n=1 Tax=Cydia fagiglandana TaxID=1458189 RepID=UPI002FEE0311